ncbi:hypothetical protein GA0115243_100872 [Streptomyces sp. ScaeMP-e83]|nr:hypothetical protein GA0115243_100872 [Streptomyces sp. ScaeMP-e83]
MSVVGERGDQIPALTLICTYDSLDKIQETRNTAYAVPPFDLAVMDEAHRIAGHLDKKRATVHDNHRIRAERQQRGCMKGPHMRKSGLRCGIGIWVEGEEAEALAARVSAEHVHLGLS